MILKRRGNLCIYAPNDGGFVMKAHARFACKLFFNRMFFSIVTVCVIPIFIPIIDNLGFVGPLLFAFTICSLYLGIEADMVWKLGKHDRQSYSTEKPYLAKGAVVSLLSELPFFLMYIWLILSGGSRGLRAVYRCFCIAPYMSLVPEDAVNIGYLLVLFISPALAFPMYIAGSRKPKNVQKKRLRDKILYKNK